MTHRLPRSLLLLLALSVISACHHPPPSRTAPARRAVEGSVDCTGFCSRIGRCFESFLTAADPRAAQQLAHLQKANLLDKVRKTTVRVCQTECGRAGYRGASAQVINQCLTKPGCAEFGPCAMNRIYRVDCHQMCHRVYVDCLGEMLQERLGARKALALRRADRLRIVGAAGYAGCVSECRRRDGTRANALGVNICLKKSACGDFSRCMRGFIEIPDPSVPSCELLFLRYKHCERLPLGRKAFLHLCRRLRSRPHLQAELRCTLIPGCARFKACVKRVPHSTHRAAPTP